MLDGESGGVLGSIPHFRCHGGRWSVPVPDGQREGAWKCGYVLSCRWAIRCFPPVIPPRLSLGEHHIHPANSERSVLFYTPSINYSTVNVVLR